MPSITRLSDPEALYNLTDSIERGATSSLLSCGITPESRLIGWADPPEDCCGMAVWISNFRFDPRYVVDERFGCVSAFLADVNIRFSQCFVDVDENGQALSAEDITEISRPLYEAVFRCLYLNFFCRWQNGQVDEISESCTPVSIGSISPYSGGGCAGGEFVVTVSISD